MRKVYVFGMAMVLSACATPHQERAATTGAIVGATAGAVIGSQSDRTAEGAVIGGVIGGLAGAVLAEDRSGHVYTSAPRYHRRACRRGEGYFRKAQRARRLNRKIDLLREGLRYCPGNPAAHNDLGVALMLKGNYRAAENQFRHALRIDPDYRPARRNLAYLMGGKARIRHEVREHERERHWNRGHHGHHDERRRFDDEDRYDD